ncbi:hypothetical protein [Nocardia sp. BMG111209]|uniref:hypothetical protein n=1 Tax=Nocardia sp. BMG111209 TaxID=1160137 RepID=UPI00036F87E8|nr:hypothetical protein [Nocardia sp. BMG111209]
MTGFIEQATDPTQLAVAHVRARVLSGRGPGAGPGEQYRAQSGRGLLGGLPTPIERELVALAAELVRHTDRGPILDRLRLQFARLAADWPASDDRVRARRLTPPWLPDRHDARRRAPG